MNSAKKITLATSLLVAGAACTATVPSLRKLPFLQVVFALLAVVFFCAALYYLLWLWGFPICKEHVKGFFRLCARCAGHNVGLLVAVVAYIVLERFGITSKIQPSGTNVAIFASLSIAATVPTMYQGYVRHYKDMPLFSGRIETVAVWLFGFLAGLAAFLWAVTIVLLGKLLGIIS